MTGSNMNRLPAAIESIHYIDQRANLPNEEQPRPC